MAVLSPRVALLVNPVARRAAATEASVMRAFRAAGVTPTVAHTRAAGDGIRVARELGAAHDLLFVLGGDGTVMEAVTGLSEANSPAAIGILPGGTGNQLARALSVPLSPARAVGALLAGVERRIDVGILNGHRRVGIGAGLGLDAAMIAEASSSMKRYLGVASYVAGAVRVSMHPARFAVRAEVDGRIIEREGAVAMVLNLGRIFRGMLEVAPATSLTDGLLDLLIVDARTLADALAFSMLEMFLRRRRPDPRWTFAQGSSVSIETEDATIRAQVDGDLVDTRRMQLTVAPGAGRLLTPALARIV